MPSIEAGADAEGDNAVAGDDMKEDALAVEAPAAVEAPEGGNAVVAVEAPENAHAVVAVEAPENAHAVVAGEDPQVEDLMLDIRPEYHMVADLIVARTMDPFHDLLVRIGHLVVLSRPNGFSLRRRNVGLHL